MDPVCHTLVGAALAESGLKKRTAMGTATLLIGANLPDVDMLSYFDGPTLALAFRRGVTHGALALAVWPLVLALTMLLWDRLVRRRQRLLPRRPAVFHELLFLALLAVGTHPALDFLNTYGMRWLMPFADTWFYGDTLFIVDPWIWAVLAAGIVLARRREDTEDGEPIAQSVAEAAGVRGWAARPPRLWSVVRSPAFAALGVVAGYIALMGAAGVGARAIVTAELRNAGLPPPAHVMVSPVPVTPFRRWVVVEIGGEYRFGWFRWLGRPMFSLDDLSYPRGPTHFAAAAATRGPEVRRFLSWARFPYFEVEEQRDAYLVHIGDARYTMDPTDSWAALTVEIAKGGTGTTGEADEVPAPGAESRSNEKADGQFPDHPPAQP